MTAPAKAPETIAKKKYGPFKVLVGRHIEDDPDGTVLPTGRIKDKVYTRDSPPFYSSSNLLALNAPQMPPKFALIGSTESPSHSPLDKLPSESVEEYAARMKKLAEEATRLSNSGRESLANTLATLEAMNLKELMQWAAEEEIDLKGPKSKEEAFKTIKAILEKSM